MTNGWVIDCCGVWNTVKASSEISKSSTGGYGILKTNKTLHYSPSSGHKLYGKQIIDFYVDEMTETKKEITWIESARKNILSASVRVMPRGWEVGLNEHDMDPVQQWCEEHNCGKRISFDTFQFKNKKEMTMFLLRWS
jgi:hypothetical protein